MLALLLFVVASIGPGMAARPKYLFHLPWACSVLYAPSENSAGDLIGAGAIIETTKVLVSVDNFNEKASSSGKRYFEVLDDIYVHAGTNYMDPKRLRKVPFYLQTRKVKSFVVAFKVPSSNGSQWEWKTNPTDISEKAGAEYDAYGLSFNVGILNLKSPFGRSPYVLPMLIQDQVVAKSKSFLTKAEIELPTDTCVTYSWNAELNKIRYHEVTYLYKRKCLELFCYWSLRKCAQFPVRNYLACFKSVKYADVCPSARGAALYCPSFNSSVFAILTTAPSCGLRRMPGVYTTIPHIISLFEAAYNLNFELDKRTSYEVFSLPQKNEDYEGVLE